MKILVIGSGYAGKRHALNLKELKCDVSIYDTDPNVMAWAIENGFKWIDKTSDYYQAGFDGAVISTPPNKHIENIVVCEANSVKNILVEKPLSLQIIGIMWNKRFDGNIMMAHNYLFDPRLYEHKKECIRLFHIGESWEYFSLDYMPEWHGVDFANNYKNRHEAKDGCMAVSMPHTIYILDYLFGKPFREEYWKSNTGLDIEADDTVTGLRVIDNRSKIIITETWNHKGIKVHGLAVRGTTVGFDWSKSDINQTYKTMLKCWIKVIEGKREIPELCKLEEGIRIVRCIEEAKIVENEYV